MLSHFNGFIPVQEHGSGPRKPGRFAPHSLLPKERRGWPKAGRGMLRGQFAEVSAAFELEKAFALLPAFAALRRPGIDCQRRRRVSLQGANHSG